MTDINNAYGYFLHLMRCAIKNEQPQEKPENVALEQVYDIAVAQKLSNLLWYSVMRLKNKPEPELMMKWQTSYGMYVNQTARQDIELESLYCVFKDNGIDVMPLKGAQIRRYYPQPDMRTMGDIDILVKVEDTEQGRERVRNIMYAEGYKADVLDDGQVDAFRKNDDVYVEIHYEFMAKHHKHYEDFIVDWNALEKTERDNVYAMSLCDLYYFNIGHFAKNMSAKGNAVRSVLDTYVMWSRMSGEDKESVNKRLDAIGLRVLNDRLVKLSRVWFDCEKGDDDSALLEKYFLTNTAYGHMKNTAVLDVLRTKGNDGEYSVFRKYLKRVFPTPSELYGRFDIKHKCFLVLPFLWLWRIILLPFSSTEKKKKIKAEIDNTSNVTDSEIEFFERIYDTLGLDYTEY